MASALSDDEFHRMQLQLIELRTEKYELESQNKKFERECQTLRETAEHADKELQKALKAINKSKKAKEVEGLLAENDSLQFKLHSQEEDFRVQNQTLLQELNKLCTSNEDLEKQISEIKEAGCGGTGPSPETGQLEDEIRRLQAQNAALQKNIAGLQSKASTPEQDVVDGSTMSEPPVEQLDTQGADTSETFQKRIEELQLNLDTEAEEKRILKDELSEKEEKHSKDLRTLQEEAERVAEKLKKKQESYLQLQIEKEKSFKEQSAKLEELQASKDRDQKYYSDQIAKLQQENAKYQKLQEDSRSSADKTIKQLQNKMAQMQQQIDAADIVGSQQLAERSRSLEAHIGELKGQVLKLTQVKDDLITQLEESKRATGETSECLLAAQQERDQHVRAAQDANKLAERRKANLDELAIQYQKDGDKHREQLLAQENQYESQVSALQARLETERGKVGELEKLRPVVDEQNTRIASLEEKNGWLERRLKETEGSLDQTLDENEAKLLDVTAQHEEEVADLKSQHSTELEQTTCSFQEQIQTLKETEESQMKKIDTLEKEVKRLKQELKDGVNEKKVHEKKGQSMLKDLKKQLHAERKRGEKLQERLQEVLSNGSHNKSIEDLLRSPDTLSDSWREDQSSISSWSGGGTLASYTNHSALGTSPPKSTSSRMSPGSEVPQGGAGPGSGDVTLMEGEGKDLLARLAEVQQEKWNMEEKVRHLETSTAAMANDLLEKSKIIEHYVMEKRTDTKHLVPEEKISFKKMLDIVKSDDQGLRDMNKKLQNMLEETLTKNMHLQNDLEMMSQEIVRLSKLPHQALFQTSREPPPSQANTDSLSSTQTQTDSISTTCTQSDSLSLATKCSSNGAVS
ncbi:GRIP1-associated protein 1-like [Mya arenaria]|uniref:GRIP1-associated protein 1-like n=1 Tax=Mya arenaria TaxID=6604 RepID=UPI0022E53C22|nr:GRIP1-associated protein 1-like [Mya arenaria]